MIRSKLAFASSAVLHLAVDRMRVAQGVELERGGSPVLEVVPHPPGGLPVVDDREGHPGGEGLVEPEIVPPGHGDEVAVPHVRELVRDHLGRALALGERRRRGVEQQQRLAEEDGARVLHRAELEVRNRDEIELRVGVGQAEVALETSQRGLRGLEREGREAALAGRVPNLDRRTTRFHRRRGLQRTDGERDQIGREGRRLLEADLLAAAREAPRALDGRVRDHAVRARRRDGDPEARLHRRLVEAREELARVGRLELGEREPVRAGARGVEAAEVASQAAGEGQAQGRAAGGDRPSQGELEHPDGGLRRATRRQFGPLHFDARAGDPQVDGVQAQPAGRARERRPGSRPRRDSGRSRAGSSSTCRSTCVGRTPAARR